MSAVTEADRARAVPTVAVAGRPNVGKSTLVNRLAGGHRAIAHEQSGVTRDRLAVPVTWDGRTFRLIDTGGIMEHPTGIDAAVARQATLAMAGADLILLVVDSTTGITREDEALAESLRRAEAPVLVVANKVDSDTQEPGAAEFHGLGLGEPVPVSALQGRGSGDLLDRILDLIGEGGEVQVEDEIRTCLVGRPNVGKSSLFNRLLRDERAVVHETPGTTRDAIDEVIELEGHRIRFVDTAGFRRPTRTRGIEYYGLVRSLRAIDESEVAVLLVDASEGLTGEDKRVAARVAEAGRGLVAVLNKWDLVPSEDRDGLFVELGRELALFPGVPVLRTSALTGLGIKRVVPAMLAVHEAWSRRVPTAEVNRILEAALAAYPPPRTVGRIRYGTQVSAGPPTFVLFGAGEPPPSYRRYLENRLRAAFHLDGVPVRLVFRAKPPRERSGGGSAASRRRPATSRRPKGQDR